MVVRRGYPAEVVTLADYEERARGVLPSTVFDYYQGGANDEVTLRENRTAFDRIALHYRVLRGTAAPDTSVSILGQALRMPILVAPVALLSMAHPESETAAVRATSAAGTVFVLSTLSTTPVEEVVAAGSGPVWFQLYVFKDRALTASLVRRAEAAGCSAIQLTVDAPRLGQRERDIRNAFALPDGLWAPNLSGTRGRPASEVGAGSELASSFAAMMDPGLTWDDVEWLHSITSLPILVKGVVRADDAVHAVEAGAAGVVVSNHGGRQLDTAPASIDVLPIVAEAVRDRAVVLVDGGIRRGTDVVKAIALGAHAVQIGRPMVWGLAVDGGRGVDGVLRILHDELALAMTLCGCRSVDEVSSDLVRLPGSSAAGGPHLGTQFER